MTYTTNDVRREVKKLNDDWEDAAWADFRTALLNSECVKLDGIGWAFFQAEDIEVGEPDSYGDYDSSEIVWIVFRVTDLEPVPGTRYFKKTGYADSYGGYDLDGELVEVAPAAVSVTSWKAI